MEELLNVSTYRNDDNQLWFRVKILLHSECLIFDVAPYNWNEQETFFRIISVAKSIMRFDANYFNKLCGDESEYTCRNTDENCINRFMKNHTVKDVDGNPIKVILQYGDHVIG